MKTKRIKTKKEKLILLLDIAVIIVCILRSLGNYKFFAEGFDMVKEFSGSNPFMSCLLIFYMIWLFILYIAIKNFIIIAIYLAYRIPKKRIIKHNTKD